MARLATSLGVLLLAALPGCLQGEPDHPDPPKPVVTGVTPAEGAPGDLVRIAGSAFGAERLASHVRFGAVDATPGVTEWSDVEIVLAVPDLAEGPASVVVEVRGVATQPFPFTIVSAALPAIREIVPAAAAPGTEVQIDGSRFGDAQTDESAVRFAGGVDARIVSWSDASIRAVVPDGAVTGGVVVVTSRGESGPFQFVVDSFAALVADIFVPRCTASDCHNDTDRKSQLSLSATSAYASIVGVPSVEVPTRMRVAPGMPDDSYLWIKLTSLSPPVGVRMPRERPPLSAGDLARIRAWIVAGAARE